MYGKVHKKAKLNVQLFILQTIGRRLPVTAAFNEKLRIKKLISCSYQSFLHIHIRDICSMIFQVELDQFTCQRMEKTLP